MFVPWVQSLGEGEHICGWPNSNLNKKDICLPYLEKSEGRIPSWAESQCLGSSFLIYLYLGPTPGEGNGTPLQYSCLENPMDGGAWWASVHGVTKSWTRLSDITHSLTYFQPTERLPQTQQSKQKKRQRNIQHVKEPDKCPPTKQRRRR